MSAKMFIGLVSVAGLMASCVLREYHSATVADSQTHTENATVVVYFKVTANQGSCIINPAKERVSQLLQEGYVLSTSTSSKVYFLAVSENDKLVSCAVNPPDWAADMLVNEQGHRLAPLGQEDPSSKPDFFILECDSNYKQVRSWPKSKIFWIDGKRYSSFEDAAAAGGCRAACRYRHSYDLHVQVCGTSALNVEAHTADGESCHKEIFAASKVGTKKTLEEITKDFPCP